MLETSPRCFGICRGAAGEEPDFCVAMGFSWEKIVLFCVIFIEIIFHFM
jgi:hypothetical protein